MAVYGPFRRVERAGDGYRAYLVCLRPLGFSRYSEEELVVRLPETARVVERGDGVYVETDPDPWLESLPYGSPVLVPRVEGRVVENIVPVATLERRESGGVAVHRFLGYYVVFEDGVPSVVRDAGVYERLVPAGLGDREHVLPARLVKRFEELSRDEYERLVAGTPNELLLAIHRSGRRDLVASVVAHRLRTDPLSVAEMPDKIIRGYLLTDDQDLVVRLAMMENTPAMIEVLAELLRTRGYDATKLTYIYMRYQEEKAEDRELERVKREGEKTLEQEREHEKRREEARKTIEAYRDVIREVMGVTVPILVLAGLATAPARQAQAFAPAVRRTGVVKRREEVRSDAVERSEG